MSRGPKPTNPVINRSHPLARGLVAAYAFEDGGGTVLRDVSGQGFDGTVTNSPTFTHGPFGGVLNFERSSEQYVPVPNFNPIDMTVAAWVKTVGGGTGEQQLFSKDDYNADGCYACVLNTNLQTQFVIVQQSWGTLTSITGSATLSTGVWYHIVYTYKFISSGTSQMRVYVDGVVDASYNSAVGPMEISSIENAIGRRVTNPYPSVRDYWDGQIADLRLYDRALSANEVAASFARPFELYSPTRPIISSYYAAPPQLVASSAPEVNKITLTRTLFT